MSSSFFYLQVDKNDKNHGFIDQVEAYANSEKKQAYIIDKPLGDNKYSYAYKDALVLLIPKCKILFINFGIDCDDFESYIEDFIEDLGSISDKYRYKNIIGRPRSWKDDLIESIRYDEADFDLASLLDNNLVLGGDRQKTCELLISLLTGSINDIDKVKGDIPDDLLDKIKQKILLFDGDQTRFVYQKSLKSTIRIQGLSGTGKTELLLHKLKEIYISSEDNRIMFTCHNRILADSLKKRIPDFFNFMKVEQQIRWDERLWCVHAWGSQNDKNSGAYRYICEFYELPFYRYSQMMTFDKACTLALSQLKENTNKEFAFDYVLIDESQDFPQSFFDLCEQVTKHTVFIAGDIFQSIFDENIVNSIEPDFLLSKCYRTDPRTLMFAHALGMGLFEPKKLRWLEDKEWNACGYLVEKDSSGTVYRLKREPLRRFEDLDNERIDSVRFLKTSVDAVEGNILFIIDEIVKNNPTALADDIGIIFIDSSNRTYLVADKLEQSIPRLFNWTVNKAYESKRKIKDTLFVSNKNNVKGLEFPFVICVADQLSNSYVYRNALYMMLTRSFIRTYLLAYEGNNDQLVQQIASGLNGINTNGYIEVKAPSDKEKEEIKTTIKFNNANVSYYDFIFAIFNELKVKTKYRKDLYETTKKIIGEDFDRDNAKDVIQFNYKKMLGD